MNLQRLKFAWARGARIQYQWNEKSPDSAWLAAHYPEEGNRIHPDDEHLQYGPVSTAFRDLARFTDYAELPAEVELFMDLAGTNWIFEVQGSKDEDFDMLIDWTRLFFAEHLADLGL